MEKDLNYVVFWIWCENVQNWLNEEEVDSIARFVAMIPDDNNRSRISIEMENNLTQTVQKSKTRKITEMDDLLLIVELLREMLQREF